MRRAMTEAERRYATLSNKLDEVYVLLEQIERLIKGPKAQATRVLGADESPGAARI
jgi:hypothetical protein